MGALSHRERLYDKAMPLLLMWCVCLSVVSLWGCAGDVPSMSANVESPVEPLTPPRLVLTWDKETLFRVDTSSRQLALLYRHPGHIRDVAIDHKAERLSIIADATTARGLTIYDLVLSSTYNRLQGLDVRGAAWLDDGSGLIVTSYKKSQNGIGEVRLHRYDLTSDERRQLYVWPCSSDTQCIRPLISADHVFIAIGGAIFSWSPSVKQPVAIGRGDSIFAIDENHIGIMSWNGQRTKKVLRKLNLLSLDDTILCSLDLAWDGAYYCPDANTYWICGSIDEPFQKRPQFHLYVYQEASHKLTNTRVPLKYSLVCKQ
ncbi:MAG: hypothetical protein GHCLOJNM_01040 [bacterium]|nr:hypothetical protein [bacterium]